MKSVELAARISFFILAIVVAIVKTKKGKTVGSLTPSELVSIMILLLLAFVP